MLMAIGVDSFSFPSGHTSRCVMLAALATELSVPSVGPLPRADKARSRATARRRQHPTRAATTNPHPHPQAYMDAVHLWAVSVSLSRVMLGRHHVLDVMAGVGVGLGVAHTLRAWGLV